MLWPFLLYTVWSCAQGNDLGGVGGGGGSGPVATSSTGLPSGSVTSTIASSTTGPGVGGAAGVGSTSGSGGSSGFGGTSGFGGSGVGATGGASSASSSSSSGGIDGFGSCVTQAQIDAQGAMGFCAGFHPFKCLTCPNAAVNPGDVVCSPTCMCTPLPPLCTSADAGTGGAGIGGAGTGGAATSGAGTGGAATSGAGTGGAATNDAGTDDAATDDASIADASTE